MDNERVNRSAAANISRTLENALQYIRGTGQWFSARNKEAVISHLVEAHKELDKLQAVVDAGRNLYVQVKSSYNDYEINQALDRYQQATGETTSE